MERAVRLGCDLDYNQAIRAHLRAAGGQLFEDLRAVTQLREFFLEAIHLQRARVPGSALRDPRLG